MILGHKLIGNGQEKIIALHDWFSDSHNYELIIPFLNTETYQFCFPDFRGYGQSQSITGRCDIDEAAQDVYHLADHIGYHRFHLIGHSMGGMVAQYMNVLFPKRLQSVTAITPVPACGNPVPEDVLAFLEDGARSNDETACQMIHYMTGMRHTNTFADYKVHLWRRCSQVEARVAYLKMFAQTDFSHRMSGIKTPYCIITGGHDAEAHQESVLKKTMGQWLPQADFVNIPNAGHYPMIEAPVDLADAISRFLEKN